MFKSTIKLPNGSIANVESATAEELASLISSHVGVITSISTVGEVVQHNSQRTSARTVRKDKAGWSDKDIMLIANHLKQTGAKHGTIQDTVRYVKTNGDEKRSGWSVYVMVNRIKQYMFDGKTRSSGLAKYAVSVLRSNGIAPASQVIVKSAAAQKAKHEFVRWSEKDTVEMGRIVRDNINTDKSLSNLVKDYIRTKGDVKNRTDATIYTVVSDIKHYLSGKNNTRVGKKMKKDLNNAGIYPVTQGEPVHLKKNYFGRTVVEA